MPPKRKWILGKFEVLRARIYSETAKRYKAYCTSKGRTVQQDLEEYIINCLK
jgi:hypothetical protein